MFILLQAAMLPVAVYRVRVTQSGRDLHLQESVLLMDIRRAAPLLQGAFQAWRNLEPAAWKFPSVFMCLAQFSDQYPGPFKEQAVLAAATTFKHRGCATPATKLVVITSEASRRTLSRAVVRWKGLALSPLQWTCELV